MAFIFDLSKTFGLSPDYTVVNFGGKFIYIDGVTRIREITPIAVKLSTKTAVVEIEGENLLIEDMDGDSVTIRGEIYGVKRS